MLPCSRPVQFVWNFLSEKKENRIFQLQVDFFGGILMEKTAKEERNTQEINTDSWRLVKVLEVNVKLLSGHRKFR